MLHSKVILKNELLEVEVGVEGEVVLQVGGGDRIPVQRESFTGHELHKTLTEVPNQPLLQESNYQASFQRQLSSSIL